MDENKVIDPIPESFASIEEAAEFWDTHDTADYWDEMQKVEVVFNIRRRVSVASDLAEKLKEAARKQGVSMETLVNMWLAERLLQGESRPVEQPSVSVQSTVEQVAVPA